MDISSALKSFGILMLYLAAKFYKNLGDDHSIVINQSYYFIEHGSKWLDIA